MKKFIVLLSIIGLVAGFGSCKPKKQAQQPAINDSVIYTSDNSKTSLNWNGAYSGTIPCADCPGIKVKLTLYLDETYNLSYQYIDSKDDMVYTTSGTFKWSEDGGQITLADLEDNKFPTHYKVGENALIQLDLEGNKITGTLAENYRLTKEPVSESK